MNDKTIAGLLIIAVTTLASVVAYLFKLYLAQNAAKSASDLAMQKERDAWTHERQKLLADFALERSNLLA